MLEKDKDPLNSIICDKCSAVSWLIVGGTFDGFVRHGCIHNVMTLFMELLALEIEGRSKVRKKKAVRAKPKPTRTKRKRV